MPFRERGNELIEQLRAAKEKELDAIAKLHAYMQSPDMHHTWLKKLTDDMVGCSELSARLWRELHEVVPEPGSE